MRHYFEFDGVKSSDYGVFISGAQTMGAAGRDVDEIVVPGMDGNLTIDNGRFNAIAHTYPAFIAEDAKEGLKGLRNALLSKRGHKRLSDTVHPDEFYRAYYEHGLEPELTANLRHSELEIEFTRDPRRFLVSGDTPQAVAVNTETLSGSVVTFDNATGADRITGLSVSIMAAQSGSGDPSPSNIRPITGWTGANVSRTGVNIWDEEWEVGDINTNTGANASQSTTTRIRSKNYIPIVPTEAYFCCGTANMYLFFYDKDKRYLGFHGSTKVNQAVIPANLANTEDSSVSFTSAKYMRFRYDASTLDSISINYPATDHEYHAYTAGNTYSITWSEAGTVYGGTLDVLNGTLRVEYGIIDLGTLDWTVSSVERSVFRTGGITGRKYSATEVAYCSSYKFYGNDTLTKLVDNLPDNNVGFQVTNRYILIRDTRFTDAESFKTAVTGQKLVYPLASPSTYQLTPTEVTMLIGENNIWADCGDVTVTVAHAATITNPTLFPSSPKIRVYGQGTLYIGNTAITVGGSFPYVDIDTEIADCSYEGQNANQYVTFSGLDFPKLEPGENYVTYTGFSDVEITPRWWRL